MTKKNTIIILIVEDNQALAATTKQILEEKNYHISGIVESGSEVVSEIKRNCPDLILMDIYLKGEMNGIEAAKEVKKIKDIPIIFMTASQDTNLIELAQKTNPLGYLIKPINFNMLIAQIEIALTRIKLEQIIIKAKEKQSILLRTIPELVFWLDSDNKFEYVNFAINTLGYDTEELIGKKFSLIVHQNDIDKIFLDEVINNDSINVKSTHAVKIINERRTAYRITRNLIIRLMHKEKKKPSVYFEINVSGVYDAPVESKEKKFLGSIGVARDISERLKNEKVQEVLRCPDSTFKCNKLIKHLVWSSIV